MSMDVLESDAETEVVHLVVLLDREYQSER